MAHRDTNRATDEVDDRRSRPGDRHLIRFGNLGREPRRYEVGYALLECQLAETTLPSEVTCP